MTAGGKRGLSLLKLVKLTVSSLGWGFGVCWFESKSCDRSLPSGFTAFTKKHLGVGTPGMGSFEHHTIGSKIQ